MTDAELRRRLLSHFYRLRDSSGGYVPVDDMIISGTEPISRDALGRVCRQLGEAGLIEWSVYLGQGHSIGSARITGPGIDIVERDESSTVDMRSAINATPPTYSRDTVIAAAHMLKALGHAGIAEFLLETGLPESAGGSGGLQGRAISLAKYALENPTELSPARRTIPFEIIQRATTLWRQGTMNNLRHDDRSKFEAAMESDGHALALQHGHDDVSHSANVTRGPTRSFIQQLEDAKRSSNSSVPAAPRQWSRKVFVVHGRDESAKNEVALFLRKIGLEEIILHQRPNRGRNLLTKFQEEAEGASFAIILMTADDNGGLVDEPLRKRARQNVVFELGFFIGKLGTPRVAALVVPDLEKPSDFDGICWIDFGRGTNWKNELARELKEARVPFDSDALLHA